MPSETTTNKKTSPAADAAARHNLEHTLSNLNDLLDKAATERAAINRQNAQHSTGPRTEAGKNRARFNAVRHGLSGRTVLLPSEDIVAYKKFTDEIVNSLAPKTPIERQLAQTVADTYWRLNRARAWEDSLLALGFFENAGDIETDCPQTHSALASAAAYRQHNQAFANLTIYEQRLSRLAERTLKQLQELQAERKAELEKEMDEAIRLQNQHEMLNQEWDPAEDGFVYSKAEIKAESNRRERSENARTAWRCDYNLEEYEQTMAA